MPHLKEYFADNSMVMDADNDGIPDSQDSTPLGKKGDKRRMAEGQSLADINNGVDLPPANMEPIPPARPEVVTHLPRESGADYGPPINPSYGGGNYSVPRNLRDRSPVSPSVGGRFIRDWWGAGGAWGLFGAPIGATSYGTQNQQGDRATRVGTYWGPGNNPNRTAFEDQVAAPTARPVSNIPGNFVDPGWGDIHTGSNGQGGQEWYGSPTFALSMGSQNYHRATP